jgi:hypothetical protein
VHRSVLAVTLALSTTAAADEGLRCDGTDAFFFAEMNASMVGYGETWDETLCDEGLAIYGEGASSRWPAWRRARTYKKSAEDQMLALVMPMFAIGGTGAVFLGASLVAFASRRKKRVVFAVPCPSCAAELAVALDDETARQLFCPACGVACGIDVRGAGASAIASARLLA